LKILAICSSASWALRCSALSVVAFSLQHLAFLHAGEFIAGADFSHLAFFEDRGIVYKDGGQPQDALDILKAQGLNCVRLRLFTSSPAQAQANPYNYTNNLDYTLPLAVRVKNAGLQFLLNFHYSDTWADPGKQTKPAAWTNLTTFAALEQQMYLYNSNTIAAFKAAGAMPEYVQVGNEIIGGLLWPDGRVGGSYDTQAQWSQLARLIKAAIRGIKDAAGAAQPKIMIHIDRGGDWPGTRWFFDNLRLQQVDFDLIGESYYAWWHGSPDTLRTCLSNAVQRYSKPIILVETAFPWTNSADLYGIPATTNGQIQYVIELANIVKGLQGSNGIGIFWWGTEYVRLSGTPLAGFDSRSFFDYAGNTLPVARAFGQLTAPIQMSATLTDAVLTLQWPLSGAGMSLVTASNLNPPIAWQPVINPIQSTGTVFTTTLPAQATHTRFYRLQSN
jgi:arabinogalactan endo-1,4-beta-galactosidase